MENKSVFLNLSKYTIAAVWFLLAITSIIYGTILAWRGGDGSGIIVGLIMLFFQWLICALVAEDSQEIEPEKKENSEEPQEKKKR